MSKTEASIDLETLARLVQGATSTAWALALGGTERCLKTYEHMANPQPGDFVMEQSTALMPSRPALDGVGELLRVTEENRTVAEWDIESDGPIPKERVFYIKTFDGREYRWTNASFVKVPDYLKLNNIVPRT